MATKNFRMVLKKNIIVEFRSYVAASIEILTILAIFFIVLQIKYHNTSAAKKPNFQRDIKLNDLSQFSDLMSIKESTIPYKLYFTPNNDYAQIIFKNTAAKLKLLESVGFETEKGMIEYFDASSTLAGVVLQDYNIILRFPNYFRTGTNRIFKLEDFWLTRCRVDHNVDEVNFYIREGFLPLLFTIVESQIEVENIQLSTGYEIPTRISSMFHSYEPEVGCVNEYAKRSATSGRFLKWSLYYFIYLVPFINLIWKLSREHEENVFAHHWIYGFSYNQQGFAHLIASLFHFILLDFLVLISIMFVWAPLPTWKLFILFAFLIEYNILLILYAMALSSLIKNAKTAVWCGAALWITSYAVFSETLNTTNFDVLKLKIFIISLIFFNNLLPNVLMDYFEEDDIKSLKEIFFLLGTQFLIILLYGCLLKSIELICRDRYMKKHRNTKGNQQCKKCMDLSCNLYEDHIEYGLLNGEVLQLKNVYSYCDHSKTKAQLRNISMRIFKNEISVILGTLNSGKTKFISTLAGWQRFSGSIAFQGQDICENWSHYRQHVDVSMSNNSLFDQLTIEDTIKYFTLLKRTEDTLLKSEQEKWLKVMKSLVNCQKLVGTLSFGEKRILALCCSLACSTSVILLDEPTVHMRSEEQSKYWDILKQEKRNRVIIVTTLDIDEANEIGDRIGILNDGCLMAWGTSYFLRNKFDGQFHLVCFLQPMKPIEPITQLIEKYITNLKIHSQFVDRVIYLIPADKKSLFQRFLIEIERNFSELGVSNVYMTGSSLNEVYMSLTSKPEEKNLLPDIKTTLQFIHDKKLQLKRNLFPALLYKKLLCQSKQILPICIICAGFCLILALGKALPARLTADRISFSGQEINTSFDHTLVEIPYIENIENGLFYYKNIAYSNDSYASRSMKNYNNFAALEVKEGFSLSVWFNDRIFHSAPLALNLAFNYLNNVSTYINKPILLKNDYDIHIILGTIMPLTMSIVFVNLQDERFSGMLTLERLAGLNDKTKWIVTFLWDIFMCFTISILYLVILITCVMDKVSWLIVMAALILFFLCGIASLFFIYLMSLFIMEENKIRAFLKIFSLQLLLGLFPYVVYVNMMQESIAFLFYIFMLLPGFSVLHGTTKVFDNNDKMNLASYFQWNNPGILDSISFLSLISFIYFTIFAGVIIYRRAYLKSTPKKVKTLATVCYPYDDERVVKEKVRISNMNIESCRAQTVLVDQLENVLPKKGSRVNTISFALNKHACLGIYGSNHSGKSHLLKQLVGENGYWFGEVYIAGFNCKKEMAKALEHVGYCPQQKGFNSLLTPTELLKVLLMMNGVQKSKHLNYLRELSVSLQLRNYMSSRIGDLPQNIKRRISVAAALVVHKKILIFDEPTRGLPAFDRLLIWNVIKYCRSLDNTIIFSTTESLELKELADSVVTVNDGEMLSYDNPHTMEYQYNAGFYLEIKLFADGLTLEEVEENLSNDVENLNRFITFFHEESELIYRCDNVCKYYIPVENVIYSYIFGSMEKNRNRLNIADYTLTPFSLNRALKSLQKSRKEKIRHERARTSLLKDARTLPRRD